MLSTINVGEDWFSHSDPYAHFGNMESEIAELRTMTKVTTLRQQIECRQEGAWMMVRDIPDERSKGGTRKITTFGRASRSVTRSFTTGSSIDGFLINDASHHYNHKPSKESEGLIEFPDDSTPRKSPTSVEITEILENDTKEPDISEVNPLNALAKFFPTKKTSVVTLGQGNVVLIDPEDSNFKVTGISKGKVNDTVHIDKDEKKVKKVGFCKTEVHFAPDSGKVNIVETDEKPPPSQVLRRKKRYKKDDAPKNSNMPKLYFGDSEKESFNFDTRTMIKNVPQSPPDLKVTEHVFSVIREPSPLLSTTIASQTKSDVINEPWSKSISPKLYDTRKDSSYLKKIDDFSPAKKSSTSLLLTASDIINNKKPDNKWEGENNKMPYLGNVSPKLSKLLENNIQHEFQLKQMQIMNKSRDQTSPKRQSREVSPIKRETPVDIPVSTGVAEDHSISVNVPIKVEPRSKSEIGGVHVQLSTQKNKVPAPEPRARRITEPLYVNNEISKKNVSNDVKVVREVNRMPKPRSSTTKTNFEAPKEIKRNKSLTKPVVLQDKSIKKTVSTSKSRDLTKRDATISRSTKSFGKLNVPHQTQRSKPIKTDITDEPVKTVKSARTSNDKTDTLVKAKKTKEPLRSFEKVSNGWVGHCIVPLKTPSKTTTSITFNSSTTTSKTQGMKRATDVIDTKTTKVVLNDRAITKSTLTTNKQFSLSKEHLKSAKLVKELAKGNDTQKPAGPRPKVNLVRPRTVEEKSTMKPKSHVTRRRLLFEDNHRRIRRDSEQSDDSVVRADEEVRAYMFNTRHKVLQLTSGAGIRVTMSAGDMMAEMTASYSEICEQDDGSATPQVDDLPIERPKVLHLPTTTTAQEDRLNRLEGMVMKEGDMISFVADDLETKIKLSSPTSYVEPLWTNPLSEGETKLLEELEAEASTLAASVDSLTENLAETLHGISALTVDCLEVYRDVVCKTCDSVDTNIKAMYQLMAKCEEMSKSMSSVYKLAVHIKNIKHLLDLLEASPG